MSLGTQKNIVIIGATSSIARHCAMIWNSNYTVNFILIGRDIHRLKRVERDLLVRNPSSCVQSIQTNLCDVTSIQSTVDDIVQHNKIDIVLISQGSLPDQKECQNNLQACYDTFLINGISTTLFAEAFAKHLEKTNTGTLVILGSVAGDRGRQSNYVYGSAKSLVECYVQGLQHRFANTNVKILLIKPGPTDTPMTAHLKNSKIALASVQSVAQQIVHATKNNVSISYVPKKWFLIMWVVKRLPNFIFHRLRV